MKRVVTAAVLIVWLIATLIVTMLVVKSYWKGNGIGYITYAYSQGLSAERHICDTEIIVGHVIVGMEQMTIGFRDAAEKQASSHNLQQGVYIYSPQPRYAYVPNLPRRHFLNTLGFHLMNDPGVARATLTRVIVPGWFIILAMALGAWWLAKAWRRFRRAELAALGLCCTCGYDLRASEKRCPECGTPF